VTAASNYTNGNLVQAAGANKTTSDSGIAAANVVTAASNYTSGNIVQAAGNNKTTSDSGIAVSNVVTSTVTLTSGNVVQGGGSKIASDSGVAVSDLLRLSTNQTVTGVKTFGGGTLFQAGINAQVGTTYAFLTTDENKLVTFSNASPVAVTLSQATTAGFTSGAVFHVKNYGAGTVTITPSTSTIDNNTTLVLLSGQGADIYSDGTNYSTNRGSGNVIGPASATSTDLASFNSTTGQLIQDSGILTANVVTASSNYTSGDLVQAAGNNKTTSDSGIVAANVTTQTSNGAANQVCTYTGTNKVCVPGTVTGSMMTNNTITGTQLAAQYSKGSCTEAWAGTGTSSALQSGDDAFSNNTCYNDSGVTRTITAVKCRSSASSNTTTVNPTFGSAGTGTTILSGALTCGSSYAYSSSGTVSNASWTTGTGIDPAMGGTLTGTSIAVIIEYTY